jgi:hypothetical protein
MSINGSISVSSKGFPAIETTSCPLAQERI